VRQRVFVKLEKKLACDLRPGDLFIIELPDPEYFTRELNRADPSIMLFLRTNVPSEMIEDSDILVHKVHIVITDPEDPPPPKVNPFAPPGMN
jgi:hypothetical protein